MIELYGDTVVDRETLAMLMRLVHEDRFEELEQQLRSHPPMRMSYITFLLIARLGSVDRVVFIKWFREKALEEPR